MCSLLSYTLSSRYTCHCSRASQAPSAAPAAVLHRQLYSQSLQHPNFLRESKLQQRCHHAAGAVASSSSSSSSNSEPSPLYSSGGDRVRQQGRLEHIFSEEAAQHFQQGAAGPVAAAGQDAAEPWGVGWQLSENNLLWNDDIKLRFVKRIASQELGVSEAEFEDCLASLYNLLPDLAPRLLKAPPQRLAQLASATHTLAARLLRLLAILPKANISLLVERRLSLLLEDDLDQVEAAAGRLRSLLPGILVDAFVEAHPQVLEVDDFAVAIEDAKRMMPQVDVAKALRNSPELVLSFQKGKHLIPYDEPWPIKKPNSS